MDKNTLEFGLFSGLISFLYNASTCLIRNEFPKISQTIFTEFIGASIFSENNKNSVLLDFIIYF